MLYCYGGLLCVVDSSPQIVANRFYIVNALKGVSSRRYGQAGFPKPYGKQAIWIPSYFVSYVGGAPLDVLKKYIQNQENRLEGFSSYLPVTSHLTPCFQLTPKPTG